jgi:hypothetical protein
MDTRVGFEMRSGALGRTYCEYVSRQLYDPPGLIYINPTGPLPDPFALELWRSYRLLPPWYHNPDAVVNDTYVHRAFLPGASDADVQRQKTLLEETLHADSMAVLGRCGCGLTTLGRLIRASVPLPSSIPAVNTLIEYLDQPALDDDRTGATPAAHLSAGKVAKAIFDHLLDGHLVPCKHEPPDYDHAALPLGLPQQLLRLHRHWWPVGDEERYCRLCDKLRTVDDQNGVPATNGWQELEYVLKVVRQAGAALREVPSSVRLIIDASDIILPEMAVLRHNLSFLFRYRVPDVYIVLLAREEILNDLKAMDIVKSGLLRIGTIMPWRREDLEQLLWNRVKLFRRGENESSWLKNVLDGLAGFTPDGRARLLPAILDGALKVYDRPNDDHDAPVHALRLAGGILAAASGRWAADFQPPLTAMAIDHLVKLYWEAGYG